MTIYYFFSIFLGIFIIYILLFKYSKKQKIEGSIFITGTDSGMGEITTIHLSKLGFHVFAGYYLDESLKKWKEKNKELFMEKERITPVKIDVTNQESIENAVKIVKDYLKQLNDGGLVAIINCAGIAYIAPLEYFPINQFRHQLEVNLVGYVSVTQAFMPLIKEATKNSNSRRGRIIFTGTGGGIPSPSPALISAYMASKWGIDAICQSFRLECQLRNYRIDAIMINPGVTKPTGLMNQGKQAIEKSWNLMPPQAKNEYEKFVNAFTQFNEDYPGSFIILKINIYI
jgi:NAD(P)-dependent dehydrogenase (short-subunit alcohol dehydrogenase family)